MNKTKKYTHMGIWEQRFQMLEEFIEKNHRFPKTGETYNGFNIGNWCGAQKRFVKSGSYHPERVQKLEEIGLLEQTHDNTWELHYKQLCRFLKQKYRLPMARERFDGFNLGAWVCFQRSRAKNGTILHERAQKLRKMGVIK